MTASSALQSDDLYERLGLERAASQEQVKRAYRALVKRFPPERAPEEFKRIREAYETLSNPNTREQYDQRADPIVERWLSTAFHAMKAKDYAIAEQYFKQVLLQEPELGYVRNWLGLCFIHQAQPEKAVAQFERLMSQPDAPAAWFGNAGHAYWQSKRHDDAERAFTEAIRRTTDSPVDYVVALADVYIEQGRLGTAVQALERGIEADGVVDFQDLQYFTKLLEVRLREGVQTEVGKVLQRIRAIASDDEQRQFAAFKLGVLAQQLIEVGAFQFAEPICRTCRLLQSKDQDYVALEEVAVFMRCHDFTGAERLIASHPSFAANGWLYQLGEKLLDYCSKHRVFARMKPISSAPPLRTINGIGTTLYGRRDQDARTGSYVATLYFVVLLIPVFPLACYRVIAKGGNSWSFLGKVPFSKREGWHLAIAAVALVIWIVSSVGKPAEHTISPEPISSSSPQMPFVVDSSASPANAPPVSSTPLLPDAQSSRGSDNPAWYLPERARVASLEADVKAFDRRLAALQDDIDRLRLQIKSIEDGSGLYSTSDPEYQLLIDRHNVEVRNFNDIVARRRSAFADYEMALNAFNQHVDDYNAHRTP